MDALASLSFLPLRLSRNALAYTMDPAPDTIISRAGLSYILTLKKPQSVGSGQFDELITLPGRELPKRTELGADVFPGAEFNVAVFLDDSLRRTPPRESQVGFLACTDMTTPYVVSTRIENAGVLVPGTDKTLALETALKGGLSVEQFAGWRDQFFSGYLAQTRQFLTWQPAEKWVETNQPEYLYYLVNFLPRPDELRLRVAVRYADGSTDTLTPNKIATVAQNTVYSIPVGFGALGLPAQELTAGKIISTYQVWISNQLQARCSEVRTYHVNRDYEPNTLFLIFANSLGGYDTLRCTGQTSRALAIKSIGAQRALSPNYLPTTAELFSLNRQGEKTLTVNTGLIDGDQLDYLSELAMSEEVYVVAQEGYVALAPADATLNLRQDDENLAGRVFSFRYAKNDPAWSNLPAPPTQPARPTRWLPVNAFCAINENGVRTGFLRAAKLELRYIDDNSLVKPLRSKANVPGTEGYTPPQLSAACATTPFTNALIQRPGSFLRNNCSVDQGPTVAQLTIPAGTYGAENAVQLQSRVDAALAQMDTQEYANQYGSCQANPALYTFAVPVGRWHYRGNLPARIAIETYMTTPMGNAWTMQGAGGPFVFAPGSNDLDFPSAGFQAYQWRLFTYGPKNKNGRVRIYKNGVLYKDSTFNFQNDGFEYHNLFGDPGNEVTIVSQDKIYVQLTDLP